MVESISLEEIFVYGRCGLGWFWEKRAGLSRPHRLEELMPAAVRQTLAFYYSGQAGSLGEALAWVWQDWCEAWGAPDLPAELLRYAQGRAKILASFEAGRITRPDGSRYQAPRLTNKYRERMQAAGLLDLGARLAQFAAGLGWPPADAPNGSPYHLGDVFADCLNVVDRNGEAAGQGFPAREVVLGCPAPYRVEVGRFEVRGQADLAVRAGPDAPEGSVILEVHDYRGLPTIWSGVASRQLPVIAAFLASPDPDLPYTWDKVHRVVYRNMLSGQVVPVYQVPPGRLLVVVASALRGMRQQLVIPRFLSGGSDCRPCAYFTVCFGEGGWDALDQEASAVAARAEALAGVARRVRESVAGDGIAAARAHAAIGAIVDGIEAEIPDLTGMLETLAEGAWALQAEAAAA